MPLNPQDGEGFLTPVFFQVVSGYFLLFGSLLGSFSNVVILRMAEGRSVVFPPSSCPHCHHRLSPLDLIPVFGWIFLRGKCRYCQAPISWQYPAVEAAAALTLFSAFHSAPFTFNLVPNAAWGIIWLVVNVLWVRGEVTAPAPFLWPFLYRALFMLITGSFTATAFGMPLVFGAVSTSLMGYCRWTFRRSTWFGVATVGLFATATFGMLFPGLLLVVTLGTILLSYKTTAGPMDGPETHTPSMAISGHTPHRGDSPETHTPSMAISGHTPHRGDRTFLEGVSPVRDDKLPVMGRALLFFWNLAGMVFCGWVGNWGF